MADLSESDQRKIDALRNNFPYYAQHCLKVRTKAGGLSPLVLNSAQGYLHKQLQAQLAAKGKVRAIVLKGRQQGVSTYVEGRYYWRTTQRDGVRAFILTHDADATNNLFGMVTRYHEHCPDAIKPPILAANAKEFVFGQIDSGYKVGTAGTKGVGRSSTIQFFHGSEVAFWPHAETHLSGILQAIPNEIGTESILESTANGVGGVFHQSWLDAKAGKGDYAPIFIPWFWQTEYRAKAPADFQRTDVETLLATSYKLTDDQLQWRRDKIDELKSEDQFKQEYPCDDVEAFLFSGRPVFDRNLLLKARPDCKEPKARYRILQNGTFEKHPDGELRVWKEPNEVARCVIGADVAEGLEHGDFSAAAVCDASTGEQVGEYHGHIAPDLYGNALYYLGLRYHRALIGVERNNHGLSTIIALRDKDYPNQYIQEDAEHVGDDKPTSRQGWLTTQKSKFRIIDQLSAELRDGDHGIRSRALLDEMQQFVIHEDGKYGAASGQFDDRVMARAIAGEMMRSDQANKLVSVPRGQSGGSRAAGWT